MKESELKTALLISGRGSTAKAVIKACQKGELKGIIPIAVICSKPDIPGKVMAESLGIKTFICDRKDYSSRSKFGEALLKILQSLQVDLVSQNGWLPLTPENVVDVYRKRIFNQHPTPLDPGRENDFGGKGMHGVAAVSAWEAYRWLSGIDLPIEATTHFVTNKYDKGDLIRVIGLNIPMFPKQITIAQLESDKILQQHLRERTAEIQNVLLPLEHQNVIETLRLFAQGKVCGFRRDEPLVPSGNIGYVTQAKRIAIQLFPEG